MPWALAAVAAVGVGSAISANQSNRNASRANNLTQAGIQNATGNLYNAQNQANGILDPIAEYANTNSGPETTMRENISNGQAYQDTVQSNIFGMLNQGENVNRNIAQDNLAGNIAFNANNQNISQGQGVLNGYNGISGQARTASQGYNNLQAFGQRGLSDAGLMANQGAQAIGGYQNLANNQGTTAGVINAKNAAPNYSVSASGNTLNANAVNAEAAQANSGMYNPMSQQAQNANSATNVMLGQAGQAVGGFNQQQNQLDQGLNALQGQQGSLDVNRHLDPSMAFAMKQGTDAIQGSAASRGMLNSGAALKDLTQYSQGLASQNYQQATQNAMADRAQQASIAGQQIGVGQAGVAGNANMFGQGAQASNNMAQFGISGQGQYGLQNAQLAQQAALQNSQLGSQANQFNAGQANNMSLQNAQMANQYSLANNQNQMQANMQAAQMQNQNYNSALAAQANMGQYGTGLLNQNYNTGVAGSAQLGLAGLNGNANLYSQGIQNNQQLGNIANQNSMNLYGAGNQAAQNQYAMGVQGNNNLYQTGLDAKMNQAQMYLNTGGQLASLSQSGGNAAAAAQLNQRSPWGAGLSSAGGMLGGYFTSDPKMKEHVDKVTDAEIEAFLNEANPKTFGYKDEAVQNGSPGGRQMGIMADDLQKSKIGNAMVSNDAQGHKQVSGEQTVGALIAVASSLNKRLKKVEGKK